MKCTFFAVKPHIIKRPEDVSAFEGEDIRLSCVVGGKPPPEVRWSRRNGLMPPARSFTLESGSVLVVKRARPEDADEYFCLAENAAGEARASAEVAVNCEFVNL